MPQIIYKIDTIHTIPISEKFQKKKEKFTKSISSGFLSAAFAASSLPPSPAPCAARRPPSHSAHLEPKTQTETTAIHQQKRPEMQANQDIIELAS